MRHLIAILSFIPIALSATSSGSETLKLKYGHVRYEVRLKTLGIGGDNVSAINRGVMGKILITGGGRLEGGIIVPVIGFDSNNTKRDKDVANILKYKEHPAITFEVVDMAKEDVERVLESDSGQVSLKAKISAAGGSKIYDIVLAFCRDGSDVIRFTTHVDAKFSDFGIKPPRLGLILKTAPDGIELSGDLVFEIERESGGPP